MLEIFSQNLESSLYPEDIILVTLIVNFLYATAIFIYHAIVHFSIPIDFSTSVDRIQKKFD